MANLYITDVDFVPTEYLSYNGDEEIDDVTSDYYQILYGILRDCMTMNKVYDIVVRMSRRECLDIVKRFKLLLWKKTTEDIIKTLNKLDLKDHKVIVHIPFTGYKKDIKTTVRYLQLAIFTMDEILTKGDKELEVKEVPDYGFPVKSMKEFFCGFYESHMKTLMRKKEDGGSVSYKEEQYGIDVLRDEMYRRNIRFIDNTQTIRPSRYFSEPERYKETFITKSEDLDADETLIEANPSETGKPLRKRGSKLTVAVLYYMLNEITTIRKENQHEIIALLNCALDKPYNIRTSKRETNNNAVKRYISRLRKSDLKDERPEFIDAVRAKLSEYGFDLPELAL